MNWGRYRVTLRHLEIFRAVCAHESVTQAAEKLNMTQPAVSMAIKELEVFYGVRLFERMNRRLYITEAGRSLLQYADTVLSQFEESVQVLRQGGAHGRCRFGMTVTIGETWLPSILNRLERELPQLDVEASIQNSRETEEMLLRNEIDFALVDNVSSASRSQRVTPLFRETMAVVCAPSHQPERTALTLAELATERLLLRESGSGTRSSVDAVFQAAGLKATPVLESISASALLACAAAGAGITILPRSQTEMPLREGKVRELVVADAVFQRTYFLLCHKNKYLTPGMQKAIEIVRKVIA